MREKISLKMIPIIYFALAGTILWNSCNNIATNSQAVNSPSDPISNLSGEKLAHIYCGGCHLYTEPSMLPKKIWRDNIFPGMGPFMGIYSFKGKAYSIKGMYDKLNKDLYPVKPTVDLASWQKMIDFYTLNAPDTLTDFLSPSKLDTLSNTPFRVKKFEIPKMGPNASSMVKIDPVHHRFFWGNAITNSLVWVNLPNPMLHGIRMPSGPVSVENNIDKDNHVNITCIGSIGPNDIPMGSLVDVNLGLAEKSERINKGQKLKDTINKIENSIFEKLPRPVQTLNLDLDQDGLKDYLICGFGHLKGSLFWMKNTGKGYGKRILRNTPGAIHAIIEDVNHDGLPDIWVLFAQSREGLSLFINKGKGEFIEQKILLFPPVQGSSSFELADLNGDGLEDIVYTCGDNADYSPILKNFHGLYIFLNQGNNVFKKAYFYPIHGCYKAVIADFDLDGKPDIVSTAYFADYKKKPSESLIYFKNLGNLNFKTIRMPGYNLGRWLTMDVGDMDGDGDKDLILGNFAVGPTDADVQTKASWNAGPPIMVLENKIK